MIKYILPYGVVGDDSISAAAQGTTKKTFPAEMPLAMAYVPFQEWEEPYAPNKALSAGTIFPSLDLPFTGREVQR